MSVNDLPDNNVFCVLPWVHQVVGTYGETCLCCFMENGHGQVEEFDRAWNGTYIRDLRNKMVQGVKVPECHICYKKEHAGQESARNRYNEQWMQFPSVQSRVERSIEENLVVEDPPIFIELRFGNMCNLMCKMCSSAFSSQILKDNVRLKNIDPIGHEKFVDEGYHHDGNNYTWYEMDVVWEHLDLIIPYLRELHISGGEPTMIRQNIAFLNRCIDMGYSDQMCVHFVTNATNVNDELITIIKTFGRFSITLSVDSIDHGYEYIRYPGNWNHVRKNVIRLLEIENTHINFNVLVQAYNVLDLPRIFDEFLALYLRYGHFDDEYSKINIDCIVFPQKFSIGKLPQSVKDLALDRLLTWKESHKHDPRLFGKLSVGGFSMIETQLRMESDEDVEGLLAYSKFQDQNKKITLEDTLPELHRMLLEAQASE